ncbi:MAG: Blasticidin-S deaminase [Lentisphaerae bacterium ADurb.BinA184]|nr:MAG: Blasticidin-S deaminase [Lentisphaerae bacterium ADurb.BinA184]
MKYVELDAVDRRLIRAASEVLARNYRDPRHTVGAAVLCASGRIYAGVNVESCGYGPCAEPIAIGRAISDGEREITCIVAVGGATPPHKVMSPCGNCRQLIIDYAPDCWVILTHKGRARKVKAGDLIPDAYSNFG